jgi:hypothetical protein
MDQAVLPMNMNLVLATGVACSVSGALFMLFSHSAIRGTATRIVVAYPRELARRRVQRQDRRFGFGMLTCGVILQALAACGYSAPLSLWRYPVGAAIAALLVYGIWRLAASHRNVTPGRRADSQKSSGRSLYETRRSICLREAAQLEAANLHARELARHPRDKGIVYLAQDWDCRWWSAKFGVSTNVLRAAMRQVGPMSKDIERHLAMRSRDCEALAA